MTDFDYAIFTDHLISSCTYLLLAIIIALFWIKRSIPLTLSLLGFAILLGLYAHRLQIISLPSIALLGVFSYLSFHAKSKSWARFFKVLLAMMGFLILFHKVPGFNNWQIVKEVKISANSLPFNMYLNFDKPLIGIFILVFSPIPLLRSPHALFSALKGMLPLCLMSILTIILLSYSMHYVKMDIKYHSLFVIWAMNNLLFACFTEEIFFRGFIQQYLARIFKKSSYNNYFALVLSSLIFGLCHFVNVQYIVLAMTAGLFYGAIYLKTKSIEASITAHFLLNTVHFLVFTYPAVA